MASFLKKILFALIFLSTLSTALHCQESRSGPSSAASLPSDAEIRSILADRIDVQKRSVGMVVGLIEPTGRRVISYGRLDQGDPRPLDGDTIFEIGSNTKLFTALLFSDMVQHGEVALDDPVTKYLPPAVRAPERNGRSIELIDLATQTSGLPFMPTNLSPADMDNPYADYSVEQSNQFLSTYKLTRDIGSDYQYSNIGFGLLGQALARRAGVNYESLVISRISDPLAMTSTAITLTPEMKTRLAVGHDSALNPVGNMDLSPAFAGTGALRSTANDLLNFLAGYLGYTDTVLAPAMKATLTTRRPRHGPGEAVGMAWLMSSNNGTEIAWFAGGTLGYTSFVGFDAKRGVGVVTLSNSFQMIGVATDIGRHLLDPSYPLASPPKEYKQIAIDTEEFDKYVGLYQLTPDISVAVTRSDNRFFAQLTGRSKVEMFPESIRDFFSKNPNVEVTFLTDGSGRATGLVVHQDGSDHVANRMGEPTAIPEGQAHNQ